MTAPLSEPIGHAPAAAKRIPSARWLRLLGIAAAAALALDLAVIGIVSLTHKPRPPASPLFNFSPMIAELQGMASEYPKDPKWHVGLGMAYRDNGHYLSAIDELQTALRLGGPEPLIRETLAACDMKVDRPHEALRELQRLLALSPGNVFTQLRISEAQDGLDQPQRALLTIDSIPRDASGYPQGADPKQRLAAMTQLVSAYANLGKWSRGHALAAALVRDYPADARAQRLLAETLLHLNRLPEAVPHLEASLRLAPGDAQTQFELADALFQEHNLGQESRIQNLLEAVINSGRASGLAYYELGLLYESHSRWKEAGQCFDTAAKRDTHPLDSLRHASICYRKAGLKEAAVYAEGQCFERVGLYPRAIDAYQELVRDHACCQAGFMHIARVQREMGNPKLALATLKRAENFAEKKPKLYMELASACEAVHDLKGEERAWQEFIRYDPADADMGYQNLGALADAAGQLDQAERNFHKCIELQPDADLYRMRIAQELLQRRSDPARLREAVFQLEHAVALAPNNDGAFFQLGMAYRYAGRNQDAVYALRHCIDLDPGEGTAYQTLSEALAALGRRREAGETMALFKRYREFYQAWETLRARTRRDPDSVVAHLRYARFCERVHASSDAIREYTAVMGLQPANEIARERLTVLERQMYQEGHNVEPPDARPAPPTAAQTRK